MNLCGTAKKHTNQIHVFVFFCLFFNATRKDLHIIATKGLLAAKMVRVLVVADGEGEGRLTGQFECAGQSCSH